MNQYPAREYRYEWGILYIKCAECWIEKTVDAFPKKKNCKFWVRRKCKECYKKQEREYRIRNKDKIAKYSGEHSKKMSDKIWARRWDFHQKTRRIIDRLWIRPSTCCICWWWGEIVAHHPSYDKIYEVVFCCKSCHNLIHNWTIKIEDKHITTLCETEDWTPLMNCERCWIKIKMISSTKFCKECSKIVTKENMKKSHNKGKSRCPKE